MARPRIPARRRDGRPGPPDRWPKDPDRYADPNNWKYPVHTPFHARAARRYFNDPANRAKYDEAEQAYVDQKINDALARFGVAAKIRGGIEEREEGIIEEDLPFDTPLQEMDRESLLGVLLGTERLARAKEIPEAQVVFTKHGTTTVTADVKAYAVAFDVLNKTIYHDCTDWTKNRAKAKLFCKHVGRFFLSLPQAEATERLRRLLRERDVWVFDVA